MLKELKIKKNSVLDRMSEINEKCVQEKRRRNSLEQREFDSLERELSEIELSIENEQRRIRSGCICTSSDSSTKFNAKGNGKMNFRQFLNGNGEKTYEIRNAVTAANNEAIRPANIFEEIMEQLREEANVFGRMQVFPAVSGTLAVPVEDSSNHFNAVFVDEGEAPALQQIKTNTVVLREKRLVTAVKLTKQLLMNTNIDLQGYVVNLLVKNLASTIENQLFQGSDAKGFAGIKDQATQMEVTAIDADAILDAVLSLHPSLLDDAVVVMNRNTFKAVKKLKMAEEYVMHHDAVGEKPAYRVFGVEVAISNYVDDNEIYVMNAQRALACMVKESVNLHRVDSDEQNVLQGTVLLSAEMFLDVKVKDEAAVIRLFQA